MVTSSADTRQSAPHTPMPDAASPAIQRRAIGVGIDTSRYGHYAAFLRDNLQPAAAELAFTEAADGYAQLRQRLETIARREGPVDFVIRVDAAGQYADNLLHFLHGLRATAATALAGATLGLSSGDPQRNKNYRAALFGDKKSDPVEARACARYALSERPADAAPMPVELRAVRQVAGRLQSVVRQRTRLINQFRHLLGLAFPELALLVNDVSLGWVLELCTRYPTAQRIAAATAQQLEDIPYLPHALIDRLLGAARCSVASLQEETMAELVRDQVRQLREVMSRQKRLENTLKEAYARLPKPNYLDTIPGIGAVTAAILTAFILDIERFATPGKLVAYFGVLPIEASSGVDRDGKPKGPKRYVMSRRGHDLVRRYLWMAALSAVRCNPAARPLYARLVAKHPRQKAIAIGHIMRKLLHLVFALWKTRRPFDKERYPQEVKDEAPQHEAGDNGMSQKEQAVGLTHSPKLAAKPAPKEVTAACSTSVAHAPVSDVTGVIGAAAPAPGVCLPPTSAGAPAPAATFVDFAHVKRQLSMTRVLEHLGLAERLRGKAEQRRGPCPIHRGDGRGRTFSVNLHEHVFQCFDARCAAKGDVIDLWAALRHMSVRDAALDLIETFGLEPAPGTEKRNG
jgi:transposase